MTKKDSEVMYGVSTWDGVSGNHESYKTLEEAREAFEREKAYYTVRGYKVEWITLQTEDEGGNEIEQLDTFPATA